MFFQGFCLPLKFKGLGVASGLMIAATGFSAISFRAFQGLKSKPKSDGLGLKASGFGLRVRGLRLVVQVLGWRAAWYSSEQLPYTKPVISS